MTRSSALFLQAVIALVGLAMLIFLLGEPHFEWRNAHATIFEIYFHDPFLAFVYAGSVPVFVAFYQAIRALGHAGRTGAFSPVTVDALRIIQRCAVAVLGFVAVGVVIIILTGEPDDRPQGIMMSLVVALGSGVVATTGGLLARKVQAGLARLDDGRS